MKFSDLPNTEAPAHRYLNPMLDAWWNDVVRNINPDRFVTFNFNRSLPLEAAQSAIRSWHDAADRKLLGPEFRSLKSRRSQAVVVFEHKSTNLHGHCGLRSAIHTRPKSNDEVTAIYQRNWIRLMKGGSLNVQRIEHGTLTNVLDYIKKEAWRPDFLDDLLVL